MKKINKKPITALAVIMLLSLLFVIALMFYPLYCRNIGSTHDLLLTYSITVDSEESEYYEVGSVAGEGLIATLIKGKKSDATDAEGIFDVYHWRLAPDSDTEYLLIRHTDEIADIRYSENPDYKNPLIIIRRRMIDGGANNE